MSVRIGPAGPQTTTTTGTTAAAGAAPTGFGDALSALLATVDESAGAANQAVAGMVEGSGDVHQAMIALQKAENSLQLTVQIRNKLVQAYQDVMRMTV